MLSLVGLASCSDLFTTDSNNVVGGPGGKIVTVDGSTDGAAHDDAAAGEGIGEAGAGGRAGTGGIAGGAGGKGATGGVGVGVAAARGGQSGSTTTSGSAGHVSVSAGSTGAAGTTTTTGSGGGSASAGATGSGGSVLTAALACTTCEAQTCGTHKSAGRHGLDTDVVNASDLCFRSTATATKSGQPVTKLCQAMLDCMHRTKCYAVDNNPDNNNDTYCYCGAGADLTKCLAGVADPNAAKPLCKDEITAAAVANTATSPLLATATVFDLMYDATTSSGAAFFLLENCDTNTVDCKAPCVDGVVSMTGAGGMNGASGQGGAAGTTGALGAAGTTGNGGTTGTAGNTAAGGATGTAANAGTGGATAIGGAPGAAGSTANGGSGTGTVSTGAAGAAGAGGGAGAAGTTGATTGFTPCAMASSTTCPDLDRNGVPDCSESLVHNPAFDLDATSWAAEGGVALSWDHGGDEHGNGSSGAVVVENQIAATIAGTTVAGAFQCLPVTGGTSYDFAVEAAIPGGQLGTGSAEASFFFFASGDCSGDVASAYASGPSTSAGMCQALSASVVAPANAHSVRLRLVAIKPFQQPAFKVEFDNVLLRRH